MLVITRHMNESAVLTVPPSDKPTQIVVHVPHIKYNNVTLAFDAPRRVNIVRTEILGVDKPKPRVDRREED